MACTCGGHNEALFAQLDKVIEQHKDQRGSLISVLHKAQGIFGYLPEEVQAYIAEKMDIPLSEIYGVVTFYALFTMLVFSYPGAREPSPLTDRESKRTYF